MVGRESGEVRLGVIGRANREALEGVVTANTVPGCEVNTDEWSGYNTTPQTGRGHATVRHAPGAREWARDGGGDGVREVHCNTMEGIWAGLRNWLRPFRGVHKCYLGQYVAVFQMAYNVEAVTGDLLRGLLSLGTDLPT